MPLSDPTAPLRLAWNVPGSVLVPRRGAWSRSDVALASAFVVALWVDAAQTRELARGGWRGYQETNPMLGPRPTIGRVNTYTTVAGLTTLGAAALVPRRVRPWLLGAALAVEAFTVASSAREGLAIRFR